MRQGMSIEALATEVHRIEDAKRDLIAPSTKMWVEEDLKMAIGDEVFGINKLGHEQLSSKLGIPYKYYQRMQTDAPELLATNINAWFRKEPTRNLVRTLDGNVRAFLSDKFRALDNYMAMTAVLPVLQEQAHTSGLQVKSTMLTERRIYLQVISPGIEERINDKPIQAGVVISNSEVGCGAFVVEKLLYVVVCSNGLIHGHSLRKTHLGRRLGTDEVVDLSEYQQDTIQADNKAFSLVVRDTVRNAFDREGFKKAIDGMRAAEARKIPAGKIDETIKEVTLKLGLSNDEGNQILSKLIEGADLSQLGVANAITGYANEVDDYDRVVELERLGGSIIDLGPDQWKVIVG